jgi:hypothetical protein
MWCKRCPSLQLGLLVDMERAKLTHATARYRPTFTGPSVVVTRNGRGITCTYAHRILVSYISHRLPPKSLTTQCTGIRSTINRPREQDVLSRFGCSQLFSPVRRLLDFGSLRFMGSFRRHCLALIPTLLTFNGGIMPACAFSGTKFTRPNW